MNDQERCPTCGNVDKLDHDYIDVHGEPNRCGDPWHDSAPSSVAEQPSREQAVEGLVEQCADEIVQTLLPSMDAERGVRVMVEKLVAPLGAREWWDGQKKYVWPGSRETLFAILDAYADHCTAPLREQLDRFKKMAFLKADTPYDQVVDHCTRVFDSYYKAANKYEAELTVERTRREAAELLLKHANERLAGFNMVDEAREAAERELKELREKYTHAVSCMKRSCPECNAALRGKEGE